LKALLYHRPLEKAEGSEITYSLVKRAGRAYLYLNVGRRKVRIASTSSKFFGDLDHFASKLEKRKDEDQILLDEEEGDKLLIFMRVRPFISQDRIVNLIKAITKLEFPELWFWAWKMREEPRKAPAAFVRLYGV
jgi:hypothetical protein